MSRRRHGEPLVRVTFSLTERNVALIEALAEKMNANRSEVVRFLLHRVGKAAKASAPETASAS